MKQHRRGAALYYVDDVILCEFSLTLHDDFVTLDGNNLTGILVYEILIPAFQNTCGKLTSDGCLHVFLVDLDFFCKIKNLKDILVLLISNGTKKSRYRQFLLTVDISIHHIVDICGKLYPRAFERYDSRRIKHCAVCMHTLSEEHARRAVQL